MANFARLLELGRTLARVPLERSAFANAQPEPESEVRSRGGLEDISMPALLLFSAADLRSKSRKCGWLWKQARRKGGKGFKQRWFALVCVNLAPRACVSVECTSVRTVAAA